eukprot:TRINITY_DN18985_c0_g1_i2.p1 TRINITY_DN18985_c0_g1~~TRINITY_DN18985_c0_g1_i2.p1  ORF type:complete len:269 (-),score=43.27 TRINITY_DN18985_c0_g1_i2:223-1029(-)
MSRREIHMMRSVTARCLFRSRRSLCNLSGASEGDQLRRRLLEGALEHVDDCGWSASAIGEAIMTLAGRSLSVGVTLGVVAALAAKQAGLSVAVTGLFERGGAGELVCFFEDQCDIRLRDWLHRHSHLELDRRGWMKMAIETRLRMLEPVKASWSEAVRVQMMSHNLMAGCEQRSRMVDIMYEFAPETRSQSFLPIGFQKRALRTIYSSTELGMLSDESHQWADSLTWLDRQLDQWELAGQAANTAGRHANVAQGIASATLAAIRSVRK